MIDHLSESMNPADENQNNCILLLDQSLELL